MLITPELPEASYLADGLVMISIWSMADAGMFFSRLARSVDERKVGFPSIITITPAFPRRLMAPSLFTIMPGDFSSTSKAVAPALVGEASTFTTVLSILVSMNGLLAVTVTSPRDLAACCMENAFSLTLLLSAEMVKGWLLTGVNPVAVMVMMY